MSILEDSYDISKYKDALIRNWKQHCERIDDFLLDSDNYNEVINRYTFLLKDKSVISLIDNIGEIINMTFENRYSFKKRKNSEAEKSNINLYEYKGKFRVDTTKYYDTKEDVVKKSWFSKAIKNNHYELKKIYEEYGITQKNLNNNNLEIKTYFLIFNNIIVPLSIKEGEDLLEYEKECRRKDDLAEIYQNSTFIPFDEYKDFIEWRKEMKEKDNESFQVMEENSK